MNADESSECVSSARSDFVSFLAKVAHAPKAHAVRAAQRSRTAAPFDKHERFELRRYLGAGSFGVVYEAFDRKLGLKVAIKVLAHAEPERLFLFKQEFRAGADVTHRNLVALFELFCADGVWFFSMELIDGRPLLENAPEPSDERISTELLARAPTLRLFLQLACGLAALHKAGLLHRDLKPSNVLVDRSGRVVVVDFGLAKVLRAGEVSGQGADCVPQGWVVGTPGYLAPEVMRGEPESRANDWFSFGVMLYQALTGRRPFAPTEDLLASNAATSFPTPSVLGIELPPALELLCMALLAHDGRERPCAEMVIATLTAVLGEKLAEEARSVATRAAPARISWELERARVQAAYRASAQAPLFMLFEAPPASGKSTLLAAFQAELRRQDTAPLVFVARCSQRELVPYQALDGLIDGLWRELVAMGERACALIPQEMAALARLFPVLSSFAGDVPREASEDPDVLRGQALCALKNLLRSLVRHGKPVVLLIDDLHWADSDSARVLRGLLEPGSAPLFVLATARSEEHAQSPSLRELRRHNFVHRCWGWQRSG